MSVSLIDSQLANNKTNLKLTISKAEVHLIHLFIPGSTPENTNDTINGNQKTNQNVNKWETLKINDKNTPATLDLTNGQGALGQTQLAGGKYSEIRLYISKATTKLPDGREVNLTIPGHNNIIRVINTFNIYAGKTTTLTLDLNQNNSIIKEGTANLLLPYIIGINAYN